MSMVNPVNWFEIPVTDIERAKSFYEASLNVEMSVNEMGPLQMAWFPMERGAPGAAGSLVAGEGYVPSTTGTLVFLHVDEIDAALERIEKAGGKTLAPKMSIGEYGWIAHFEDSEGNRVALHQAPA